MAEHPHAADFQNTFLRDIVLYTAFCVNAVEIKRKKRSIDEKHNHLYKNREVFILPHKSDFKKKRFFSFQVDCFFSPRPIKA